MRHRLQAQEYWEILGEIEVPRAGSLFDLLEFELDFEQVGNS
jgi:hypothetical protein